MNIPAGILLQLCATLSFAAMSTLARGIADEVTSGQIVFARSFIGLLPLLVWVRWRGEVRAAISTRNVWGHVVRGLVGVCAMWGGFAALGYIPLAEAIAFTYVTPLMTVVLAAVLLRERVPGHRWIAVGIGFLGIVTMLTPLFSAHGLGADGAALGVAFALGGAICAAFAVTQVRRLTQTETTGAIVFYFSVVSSLAALTTAPWWTLPSRETGFALIGIGLLGGAGQIMLTAATRFAPASVVAPFNYATLLWAIFFGALFFREWPHPYVFIGAALVVAAGAGIAWRDGRLSGRPRSRTLP
ncbi:DMT family transporter [Aquabacter spiritensis]|uniref:EamA domain-containing membrane protein RarD n=1 Tax=Aquabacter spiritensis TaxID=933073 RepID=A0A4R3LVU1_9HYPH|nr:DMT family transporter [Aquabacter spiritensis]TCT04702.1 EamA domain-containing membrane protein RarD [Aquabacter spiritensis]